MRDLLSHHGHRLTQPRARGTLLMFAGLATMLAALSSSIGTTPTADALQIEATSTPIQGIIVQIQPTPTPTQGAILQVRPTSTPTATTGVIAAAPTSTPTPTPTVDVIVTFPTATPTLLPTSTPTSLPTPTPQPPLALPSSTPTPTPTDEPELTVPTPEPTATPTPELDIAIPPPSPTPELDIGVEVPTPGPFPTFDPNPQDLTGPSPTPTPPSFAPTNQLGDADLRVTAIEVTQGIQDLDSRMPLIAERKTWVRVHVAVNGTDEPVSFIDGAIKLQKSGMAETIMQPVNGPINWFPDIDRTDINSALNFELDDSWLTGEVTITAVVYSGLPSSIEDEPIAGNNMKTISVEFQQTAQPELILIPLHDGTGPGPNHTLSSMLDASVVVLNDLLTYHPVSSPEIVIYPAQIGPDYSYNPGGPSGALASDAPTGASASAWDLTWGPGRTQPNLAMRHFEVTWGLKDAIGGQQVMGIFDADIPSGGFGGWANNKVSWTKPNEGTPAHEFGHDLGLPHVGCKDDNFDGIPDEVAGGSTGTTHPNAFPNCSLAPIDPEGYFGFTTYVSDPTIYSNDPGHPLAAYPFMSYKNPGWTDAFDWCRMINWYQGECSHDDIGVRPLSPPNTNTVDCDNPTEELCLSHQVPWPPDVEYVPGVGEAVLLVPASSPSWVVVSTDLGHVDTTDDAPAASALLDMIDRAPGDAASSYLADHVDDVLAGQISPEAIIRVTDADGQLLAAVPAIPFENITQDLRGPVTLTAPLSLPVPWPATATTLELTWRGITVLSESIDTDPPVLTDLSLNVAGPRLDVVWSGSDADNVSHDVLWSADDGQTWIPIARSVEGTGATVEDTSLLPGGEVIVRVRASHGLATTTLDSRPLSIELRAPIAAVMAPVDQTSVLAGHLLELHAFAQDPEDGLLLDDAITWSSDLDGELGVGRRVARSDLSVGKHLITVTATDSMGATSTDSVSVTVLTNDRPKILTEPSGALLAALAGDFEQMPGPDQDTTSTAPDADVQSLAPVVAAEGTGFPLVPVAAMLGVPVLIAGAAVFVRRRTR